MTLDIIHETLYTYEQPVFVEPHYLHFYPQARPHLDISTFDIHVSPTPSGISRRIDAENNSHLQCWFNEKLNRLHIITKIKVETHSFNPFNFYIDGSREIKEFINKQPVLMTYLKNIEAFDQEIIDWIEKLKKESGKEVITFLMHLNSEISARWNHAARYSSDLMTPKQLFSSDQGSCRDLSWFLMLALRYFGYPTRFVSGYAFNPELGEGHELHAWVEVWLPGAGWIGLDPSAGLFANEVYIPVTSSHDPILTLPVVGHYRGNAKSTLSTSVKISQSS